MLHTTKMPRFPLRIVAAAATATLLLFFLASQHNVSGASWSTGFYHATSLGLYDAHLRARSATANMAEILNRTLGVRPLYQPHRACPANC